MFSHLLGRATAAQTTINSNNTDKGDIEDSWINDEDREK